MWKLGVALFLCMSVASASVDDKFPDGALGLPWGATLQQVQSAYPGGVAWPVNSESEGVAYVVPGSSQTLGVTTPVKLVQFLFTKDNELHTIFFHFAYSDRDSALHDVAELLGHDYDVKDEAVERLFRWGSGKATRAQFRIGVSTMQPWAYLGLRVRIPESSARK